jgi:hypothetical protein
VQLWRPFQLRRLVQDLGDWQDDHADTDLEESQRDSGQDASACRCPLEQELLGRHLQWHGSGKAVQCPALAHLDLQVNLNFGTDGAVRLAGVLGQCRELVHINLSGNQVEPAGAKSLAGVLAQCAALAHLDLFASDIRDAEAESLTGVLGQCAALAHLNLRYNSIGDAGAQRLAGVLGQCAALAHLDLGANGIGTVGRGRLQASWCGQANGLWL